VTARLSPLPALLVAAALAAPAQAAAPRSFSGRLEIRHTDDFTHARSSTTYELVRRGRRIRLALARSPRVPSGSAVVVKGRRVGSRLKGTLRPVHSRLRAAGVTPGPRKTAVILVQFSATPPPWTPAFVRQRVFTDPNSTNAYYQEDSYGDVSLVGKANNPDGDVFGWYTVPAPGPDPNVGCDVDSIATNAEAAAGVHGFVASGYDHVIYAFPPDSLCGWAGLGELPGTRAWINGAVDRVNVVAHELGHNMGLHHASSLRCTEGGVPVAISSTCTTSEYGDPFDVMGSSSHRNNAWHLRQIGFIPATNVHTVTADGTYTLDATSARGGTQLLRVQRPGAASPPYYDLDLRAPGGVFDDFGPADFAVQGVTIHTDPEPDAWPVPRSWLIDANPGSSSFADAPLAVGHSFSDGSLSITVQSIAGGVATVQVTTGQMPPDTTPPTVPAPVAAPSPDRVVLSWPASTDDVGVAGYRAYRSNTLLRTTTSTTWTDFVVTPGASYSYRVDAFDAAGNVAASAPVSVTVPFPPPPPPTDTTTQTPTGVTPPFPTADTTRPSVTIASPARSARLRRRATVRALAVDAGGVKLTEVWVDSVRRKVVHSGRLAWRWPLKHARPGRHLIVVRAFDTAGNEGQASARVRVVR
jgi:hypothetical protein